MREQLDLGYVYGGLPTFGQRPFLTEPEQLDSWQPDVAVVGAPFDLHVTNRPGARFGPRAIRSQAYEPGTYHLDLGIEIFEWLEVVDFGDAYCPNGQPEQGHANIRTRVSEIASRGIVPIILGGDHSITWPAATAVADHHGWGKIGIVHFDAHADTANIIDGNLASHGTPMRRLIESGAVLGKNFVQIGLRGYWPPKDTFEWMKAQGMRWHLMNEVWERGIQAVIADAVAEAGDGADALYISVVRPRHRHPRAGGHDSGGSAAHGSFPGPTHQRRGTRHRRGVTGLRRGRQHRQQRPPGGLRGAGRHGLAQAPGLDHRVTEDQVTVIA
jgi:agmatinase